MISTYVTNFNAVTLGVEVRDKIRGIHDRSDLSHGMKVLLVHEELQNAGALEHADTHDFAPQPFQLSQAD